LHFAFLLGGIKKMNPGLRRNASAVLSALLLLAVPCIARSGRAETPTVGISLVPTRYDLRIRLEPEEHNLRAQVDLTLRNQGGAPVTQVPFMLYRLLRVDGVTTAEGQALSFEQRVTAMADEASWQVNHVQVTLAAPLAPGAAATLRILYHGGIYGYREVMGYVQETIAPQYMLLRAETMPYPILGDASEQAWRRLFSTPFQYSMVLTAPAGYRASCAGDPATARPDAAGTTVSCASAQPVQTMSFALARFKVIENLAAKLRVYALPEDAAAGERVLREMERSYAFYAGFYGPLDNARGTELIELPEGWGSYTGAGFIFQTAAAFRNPAQAKELYHEVSHAWNAKPPAELQRTRWFDEAFAMYAQALALRSFQGEKAYRDELDERRSAFVQSMANDPRAGSVAIADYGREEMGDYSYTKGDWSLYVLHETIGEKAFQNTVTRFQREFRDGGASFEAFQRIAEAESGRDLTRFFQEWIWGVESSRLLKEGASVQQIAARYAAPGN
jgi:hypothetical protein